MRLMRFINESVRAERFASRPSSTLLTSALEQWHRTWMDRRKVHLAAELYDKQRYLTYWRIRAPPGQRNIVPTTWCRLGVGMDHLGSYMRTSTPRRGMPSTQIEYTGPNNLPAPKEPRTAGLACATHIASNTSRTHVVRRAVLSRCIQIARERKTK